MLGVRRLLVVVDMQHDFVDGALGTPEAVRILPAAAALIAGWRGEVVYTLDTHGADYLSTQEGRLLPVPHCIKGTRGHSLVPGIGREGARTFEKGTFGSIALAEYARQFDEIAFCGLCTDICVISNALLVKAFAPEAALFVAADACAGTTPAAHEAALAAMRSCQVRVVRAAELL